MYPSEKMALLPQKLNKSKLMVKQSITGTLFLVPTIVLFIIFAIIPVTMGIIIAFMNFDLMSNSFFESLTWAGVDHFKWVFDNKMFLHSLLNILVYVAMFVPQTIIFSLLVAVLLNNKLKAVKFFRILFYLPAVTSGIAIAFVWRLIFKDDYGILSEMFPFLPVKWLGENNYFAMFCITVVTVWSSIGGNMLIFLAGLKGISPELYEAAEIDGANKFKQFIFITVPMLSHTLFFVLTMSLIGAFQLFDIVQILGATNYYTQTPVTLIYGYFGKRDWGVASASSAMLFAVIMAVTFIVQFITKKVAKEDL